MSQQEKPEVGSISWFDLTVPNTEQVRDFYSKVVGWKAEPVSLGDYDDFNMNAPESGRTVTGICHKKGPNEILPSQWLLYITVANVEESAKSCTELDGKLISPPKKFGNYGKFCVIEDPAGAVCGLFEPA